MLTSSGWDLLMSIIANILVPFVPGMLFLWLCFGHKFKGILFYLLSWFVGVGVVGQWLFDLQFVWFGVGILEYLMLIALLLVALLLKFRRIKWTHSKEYIKTLEINLPKTEIIHSYKNLWPVFKALTRVMALVSVLYLVNSFIFTVSAPTYGDDSFSNRNRPIVNILHDGGVALFGENKEILGRGTLGYPINIAIYKSVISEFTWGFNDYYTDLFQWFALLFCFLFIIKITRDRTKSVLFTLAPIAVLTMLPLVFIHSVESYHDLPVTIYAVIVAWSIYHFFTSREISYLTLSLLLTYIMSYIKLEWLIIYAWGLYLTAGAYLLLNKKLRNDVWDALKSNFSRLRANILLFVLFFIPFQIVRVSHGLWFNPSSIEGGEAVGKKVHREIFDNFRSLFLKQDNYGIALIPLFLIVLIIHKLYKRKNFTLMYFFVASITIFVLFTLVFLLTNNYQWFLSQTTVNRVYTMCFFMLFAFIWFYLDERETK